MRIDGYNSSELVPLLVAGQEFTIVGDGLDAAGAQVRFLGEPLMVLQRKPASLVAVAPCMTGVGPVEIEAQGVVATGPRVAFIRDDNPDPPPDPDTLHPPTDVRAELIGTNQIHVSWTDAEETESGYHVVCRTPNREGGEVTLPANSREAEFRELLLGRAYTVVVCAVRGTEEACATPVIVVTPELPPPPPATQLIPVVSATAGSEDHLTPGGPFLAEYAFDGNGGTHWVSDPTRFDAEARWIEPKLNGSWSVEKLRVVVPRYTERKYSYVLQEFANNQWQDASDVLTSTQGQEWNEHVLEVPTRGGRVRLRVNGNSAPRRSHIAGFASVELWGKPVGENPPPPPPPVENRPPVLKLVHPEQARVSEPIRFDASGSTDPDGDAFSVYWDFGDGTAPYSGAVVLRSYIRAGNYAISVGAADNRGAVARATSSIRIVEGLPPEDEVTTNPAYVQRALEDLNRARANNGLRPYTISPVLTRIAQSYAEWEARENFLSHNGNPEGSSSIWKRLREGGWRADASPANSNEAGGARVAYDYIITAWLGSSGHRETCLSRIFTECGLGYAETRRSGNRWVLLAGVPETGGGGGDLDYLEFRRQVIELTNAERIKEGFPALSEHPALMLSAQRHSADMDARNFFSHVNPDGESVVQRVRKAGYNGYAVGENIARGYGSPAGTIYAWMHSDGHRANILNATYTQIGVGIDGDYYTQNFGAGG